MKALIWNHSELRSEFPDCRTLKDIMTAVNKKLWAEDGVICDVKLNDTELGEELEIQKSNLPVSQIFRLEVVSQTLPELISNTVESHIKFIPKIKAAAIECSEVFRNQDMPMGQAALADVLKSCQWMTESLSLLKVNIKQWDGFMEFGPDWGEKESQYSSVVHELVTAYESKDVQLLADVLEYELANSLDGWIEVFEKIQKRMINPSAAWP